METEVETSAGKCKVRGLTGRDMNEIEVEGQMLRGEYQEALKATPSAKLRLDAELKRRMAEIANNQISKCVTCHEFDLGGKRLPDYLMDMGMADYNKIRAGIDRASNVGNPEGKSVPSMSGASSECSIVTPESAGETTTA